MKDVFFRNSLSSKLMMGLIKLKFHPDVYAGAFDIIQVFLILSGVS